MVRRSNCNREWKENWVVEVEAKVHHILEVKEWLHIDFDSCRTRESVEATTCYHCQSYGHIARHCREATPTEGHCGGGHKVRDCDEKDADPACIACRMVKRQPQVHK